MQSRSTGQRVAFVLLGVVLLTLSAGMAWATIQDYDTSPVIPENVIVAGQDVGGMTIDEARDVVEKAVKAPLLEPVTVHTEKGDRVCDPADIVSMDVDKMIAEAYSPWQSTPFVGRLISAYYDPYSASVETTYSVDPEAIKVWVAGVAKEIDRPAKNATIELVDGAPDITPERVGRKVDQKLAAERVAAAIVGEKRDVDLPVKNVAAKITKDDFGRTIVVDRSERRLRLFDGEDLLRTWAVAVGTPQFPTPLGEWEIVLKRFMPTWRNPGSDWAKSMPDSIPPGPTNPLGVRALNLNASGIRIHGTSNIGSIGTAASHGCIRMLNSDVSQIYDMVEVGTPVYVIR